ncbi:MAG: response regulator transcription factor [Holophagales bacterium]|nr:response regulator transcription factor [Holophagales bacterium]
MTVRTVLADDHAIVRRGLAALLELEGGYEVVAEANDGQEALTAIRSTRPDLLILDLSMPHLDGLDTLGRLKGARDGLKVLVLSMYDDPQFVARALDLGADGYLLKHALDDELFQALTAVLRGQRYTSRGIDLEKVRWQRLEKHDLTAREREVLQWIAKGCTTQEVASRLSISPHTATRHRANLMEKLGVHNQVELLRVAVARGLILLPKT